MRGTAIAPVQVLRELSRLLDVYSRPKHWPPEDESIARSWAEILGDVSVEQLAQAVSLYVREDHQFMPRPGSLRVLALKQRGVDVPGADPDTFDLWLGRGYEDATGRLSPCPACGRAWQAHPRVTLVHDHARHREAGLPCVGSCDSQACLGTYSEPQKCPPEAMSTGEVWVAPAGWSSDLRRLPERTR